MAILHTGSPLRDFNSVKHVFHLPRGAFSATPAGPGNCIPCNRLSTPFDSPAGRTDVETEEFQGSGCFSPTRRE